MIPVPYRFDHSIWTTYRYRLGGNNPKMTSFAERTAKHGVFLPDLAPLPELGCSDVTLCCAAGCIDLHGQADMSVPVRPTQQAALSHAWLV